MYPRPSSRKGFTLIELLVVIAIIAILSVVVILTLNPAELLRQSRDSNRVSDMDTLTHALAIYSTDVSPSNLGSANTIYVSIPDPIATSTAGDQCQGLGLPTLPSIYTYHCAATSTNRNVDGTGWIPVNFKNISSGSPIGNLPIDPTNNSSTRNYYAYVTDGTTYEMTAPMESIKYKPGGGGDVITGDGGTKASIFEKGTNLTLEPLDYGYSDNSLVADWIMDEGTASTSYDYSGNNMTGTWHGTPAGAAGYYSSGKVGLWAGTFDGTSDWISTASTSALNNIQTNITLAAWVNPSVATSVTIFVLGNDTGGGGWGADLYMSNTGIPIMGVVVGGAAYTASSTNPMVLNTWYYLAATRSGTVLSFYVNGVLVGTGTCPAGNLRSFGLSRASGIASFPGFSQYFFGLIDDVRVYNRALSAAEIQAIYNGGK